MPRVARAVPACSGDYLYLLWCGADCVGERPGESNLARRGLVGLELDIERVRETYRELHPGNCSVFVRESAPVAHAGVHA